MSRIRHQSDLNRFTLELEGLEAGHITYDIRSDGGWNINHTEVSPDFRGRGLAKELVDAVIEHAKAHNIRLTSTCDYAGRFL